LISSLSIGCAGEGLSPGAPSRARETLPQWQDVFEGSPDIYAVVQAQRIKRDQVYGALFKSLFRAAQARTEMRGVTALEALEGCEEIIVGIRKDARGTDAALVFRGVPANLDPEKMTDAAGHPLLRLVDSKTRVPEYEWIDPRGVDSGSLFVLPDRTWVGTMGEARDRARQVFAAPVGRRAPPTDPEVLASVRFDAAAAFLSGPRVRTSLLVGPLTKRLRAATLALRPGKGGVVATLQYDGADDAVAAEAHAKGVLEAIGPGSSDKSPDQDAAVLSGPPVKDRPSLQWLKDARVTRQAESVLVTLQVPARLLEELPRATGRDLSL